MRNGAAAVLGLLTVASTLLAPSHAHAQALRTLSSAIKPAPAGSICGQPVPRPQTMPPAGSGPVVYLIAPCFERQGGRPRFDPETYLKDILLKPSRPPSGEWTPYDALAEQLILQDFQRLWNNHPLADLTVEILDYTFSNGVVGKLITYDMIERN